MQHSNIFIHRLMYQLLLGLTYSEDLLVMKNKTHKFIKLDFERFFNGKVIAEGNLLLRLWLVGINYISHFRLVVGKTCDILVLTIVCFLVRFWCVYLIYAWIGIDRVDVEVYYLSNRSNFVYIYICWVVPRARCLASRRLYWAYK